MAEIAKMTEEEVRVALEDISKQEEALWKKGAPLRARLDEIQGLKALKLIQKMDWTPEVEPDVNYVRIWCHDTQAHRDEVWDVFRAYHGDVDLPVVADGLKHVTLYNSDFDLYITFDNMGLCRRHVGAWDLRVDWASAREQLAVLQERARLLEEALAEEEV